jgi:Secretion system C-terminal sorting domain
MVKTITDIQGKVIATQSNFTGKTTFNTSAYSAGVYFLQLKSGKEVLSKKFVVTK